MSDSFARGMRAIVARFTRLVLLSALPVLAGCAGGPLVGIWRQDDPIQGRSDITAAIADYNFDGNGSLSIVITVTFAATGGDLAGCVETTHVSRLAWVTGTDATGTTVRIDGTPVSVVERAGCVTPSRNQAASPGVGTVTPLLGSWGFSIGTNGVLTLTGPAPGPAMLHRR